MSSDQGMAVGSETVELSRGTSLLKDFAEPLPRLIDAGAIWDLDGTFGQLGKLVGAVREPMTVAVRITGGNHARSWFIDADPAGCRVSGAAARRADVEVILDPQIWQQIASGGISPLEAFTQGRMRVRGSISIARRFVRAVRPVGSPTS